MNGIIDTYTHSDCRNSDSHNIQRNVQPPHKTKDQPYGNNIDNQGDHSELKRSEEQEKHQKKDDQHKAKHRDL